MNPTNYYSDPALVQARNESQTAMSAYGTAQQNTMTMPELLKQALDKKFNSADNPLLQDRANALNDYTNASNTGYQSVLPENNHGLIFAPSSQLEQIQARQNSALSNLSMINSMLAGGENGILNLIDRATNQYKAQEAGAKNKADIARQKYQDLLDEIDKKVQQSNVDRTFAENVREFGLNYALEQAKLAQTQAGGADTLRAKAALMQDVQKGIPFYELYPRYASQLPEYDIRNAYNSGPLAKQYGPAKETSTQLLGALKDASVGQTADQKNRKASLAPAKIAIQSINPDAIKMAGPQNRAAKLQIDLLGGLGVDQRIVSANQQFELMKQSVVRALQGARMSNKDIEIAKNYIPSITDTSATINTKLANLNKFIDALGGDYVGTTTTNNKATDPLGLF